MVKFFGTILQQQNTGNFLLNYSIKIVNCTNFDEKCLSLRKKEGGGEGGINGRSPNNGRTGIIGWCTMSMGVVLSMIYLLPIKSYGTFPKKVGDQSGINARNYSVRRITITLTLKLRRDSERYRGRICRTLFLKLLIDCTSFNWGKNDPKNMAFNDNN